MPPRSRGAFVLAVLALALARAGTAAAQEPRDAGRAAGDAVDAGTKALQAGDLEAARAQFRRALDLVPGLPGAHAGLGRVALRTREHDVALREFELARAGFERRDAGPAPARTLADVYYGLGTAHARLDHVLAAREAWEACVALDPAFALAYRDLALLYVKAGRSAEAKAALDKAEALGVAVSPELRYVVDEGYRRAQAKHPR